MRLLTPCEMVQRVVDTYTNIPCAQVVYNAQMQLDFCRNSSWYMPKPDLLISSTDVAVTLESRG